jgi:hypothetical protein
MDLFNLNGALFSEDRKYRFVLWRIWDEGLSKVMFIGLNPSTANEYSDDPTIRRVKSMVKNWGYGGIYMLNLFTYVTAYPKELKLCSDPLYKADEYLKLYALKCERIIAAWGSFKENKERAIEVLKFLPNCEALAINKDGSPKHPLYIKNDVIPVKFGVK